MGNKATQQKLENIFILLFHTFYLLTQLLNEKKFKFSKFSCSSKTTTWLPMSVSPCFFLSTTKIPTPALPKGSSNPVRVLFGYSELNLN